MSSSIHEVKVINSNRGFTILESLVGIGLLGILLSISISSVQQVKKISQSTNVSESSDKQILQIIENVRSSMNSFKATYDYYDEAKAESLLADDKLAMAWDTNTNTTVEKCPTCNGRYGYVLQPYEKFRGLFILTLKINHKNWAGGPKTYKFLVTAK